jgi:hypothetical protein
MPEQLPLLASVPPAGGLLSVRLHPRAESFLSSFQSVPGSIFCGTPSEMPPAPAARAALFLFLLCRVTHDVSIFSQTYL